jgi:hypothetical protein
LHNALAFAGKYELPEAKSPQIHFIDVKPIAKIQSIAGDGL